jgi:hypothetical protein
VAVLKLRRKACARCGSLLDLPHTALKECLAANSRETHELLQRSRELIEKRAKLARARLARITPQSTKSPRRRHVS